MKKILTMLTVLIFAGGTLTSMYAVDPQDRKAKKEAKKAKIEQEYKQMAKVLENKSFVLEADFLADKYGQRFPVTSTLNFIMVDGEKAVLQIGSNRGIGYNGVGGVTAEGNITDWELKKNDKKNNFTLSMNVMTALGTYDVHFSIGAAGHANATISGITGGRLTYSGDVVPAELSDVYKGSTTY